MDVPLDCIGVEVLPAVVGGERLDSTYPARRHIEALGGLLGGGAGADVPVTQPPIDRGRVNGEDVPVQQPRTVELAQDRGYAPARCTSSMWYSLLGATFQMHPTRRLTASMSSIVKSRPASWAAARMCSTVLVDPPMATSSAKAFSKAAFEATLRGSTDSSSSR